MPPLREKFPLFGNKHVSTPRPSPTWADPNPPTGTSSPPSWRSWSVLRGVQRLFGSKYQPTIKEELLLKHPVDIVWFGLLASNFRILRVILKQKNGEWQFKQNKLVFFGVLWNWEFWPVWKLSNKKTCCNGRYAKKKQFLESLQETVCQTNRDCWPRRKAPKKYPIKLDSFILVVGKRIIYWLNVASGLLTWSPISMLKEAELVAGVPSNLEPAITARGDPPLWMIFITCTNSLLAVE